MEGAEGIGEAVTGGLVTRALEPEAGEAGNSREGACLNCRTPLHGDFCHACGQKAHVHRTIGAWWHDFLHSVLHLDGKFWRTLPMLAWRPGELTRRYVEGERARFISPLALFLFSVFLMFAAFSLTGGTMIGSESAPAEEVQAELAQAEQQVARLEKERAEAAARGGDVEEADRRLRQAKQERDGLAVAGRFVGERPILDTDVKTGWDRLDQGMKKANENPGLLFYKVQANAYKFSWALIPISVPFLWLLFLHRRRYRLEFKGYDHLVFVTYSIAFMSLLLILFVLVRTIGIEGGLVNLAFLAAVPVHMYRQLKGAYRLSRWSALWRAMALLFSAAVALNLFLLLLIGLGVLA